RSGTAAPPQRRIFRSPRSGYRDLAPCGGRFFPVSAPFFLFFFFPRDFPIFFFFLFCRGCGFFCGGGGGAGKGQQIVSYRDNYTWPLMVMAFLTLLANSWSGLPVDVRVLVMAASARRRWSAALV